MNEIDRLAEAIRAAPRSPGFADRVMDGLPNQAAALGLALWDRPLVQGVLWVAACLVLVVRVGSALALFLPG